MADGTLFGLVRDIGQRRQAARVRNVLRDNDYFNKPLEAIEAVNEAGFLEPAVALRDAEAARLADAAKRQAELAEATRKTQEVDQNRYRGAVLGVTQALKGVRDQGGDLGAAFDNVAPALTRGFGMAPEEVVALKTQVAANPGLLDQFEEMFADPTKAKFGVLPAGAAIMNERTGEISGRNPGVPKVVQVKRGDGGVDVLVVDEQGNFIQSGATGPVGSGSASVPSGSPLTPPGAGYSGPLNIDPTARGVRNGNPGNIKDGPWARKQPGYIGSDGTFAKFAPGMGEKAQENLLGTHYVNGQRNVNQIVDKYLGGAANKENSTASQRNYKAYVAGRLGIDPEQPVPQAMLPQLAQAMREFENGTRGPVKPGTGGPAYSTPGKPQTAEGWRDLSPEEKKSRGLPADRVYQIGVAGANTGKIVSVGGQPAVGKAGKPAGVTLAAHNSALSSLARVRDQARRIRNHPSFSQATGSIQGRLPSLFQNTVNFDKDLQSYKDVSVIEAMRAMKAASPNGASGFGSLQLKEGERLENSTGSISQTDPDGLQRTLRANETDAMVSIGLLYNIPPDATRLLVKNPAYSKAFDQKYGKGLAKKILGN